MFSPAIAQTLEHFTKLPKHTYTRPEEADFVPTIVSHYLSPAYSRFVLTFMSSGSQILAFLSKHWWLNCSTFALQSSKL
jgi:hypothetical protein